MKRALLVCILALAFLPRLCLAAPSAEKAALGKGSPPIEVMVGQMIMTGFRGTGTAPLTEDLNFLLEDIRRGRVGGVILFDRDFLTKSPVRNIVSLQQVRGLVALLQKNSAIPLLVGVDQEGGKVRRFKEQHGVAATPSPAAMGKGTPAATEQEAYALGVQLAEAGITLDFAPALDVDVNPASPAIGALGRSFSGTAARVASHGRAFAKGLNRAGVGACFKHFPGHGSAADDTHLGMADITATWTQEELLPYRELLPEKTTAMVMAGHMAHRGLDKNLPASLSYRIITGLLREKLGWSGVVITDDLQMQAVESHYSRKEAFRLAINAGVDILLLGNNLSHDPREGRKAHATVMELVREGQIPPARIEVSYKRIMAFKQEIAALRSGR